MHWVKKGHVFNVSGNSGWMRSHAQIPTVLVMADRFRIYFATRPERRFSLTSFIDVDLDDPCKILYVHDRPILEPGGPGSFDEHGVMPSSVCEYDGKVWLYYAGWSRRVSVPYSNWTGLAISEDAGKTFRKRFGGPVVDRTRDEIHSATGCYVLRANGDWHMWYASGVDWIEINDKLEEYYVIKYASSADGISWQRENRRLLTSKNGCEPTHRPTVRKLGQLYHMWFCYRGIEDFRDGSNSYRIGYASSADLRRWTRADEKAGITVSAEGWDSKMIAYPYVVEARNRVYMFYCGNGFGSTGFGVAVLDRTAGGIS